MESCDGWAARLPECNLERLSKPPRLSGLHIGPRVAHSSMAPATDSIYHLGSNKEHHLELLWQLNCYFKIGDHGSQIRSLSLGTDMR